MIFGDFCLSWTDELTSIHAVIPETIAHPELAGVRNSGAAFLCDFIFFCSISLSVGPPFDFTFSCPTLDEFHSEALKWQRCSLHSR